MPTKRPRRIRRRIQRQKNIQQRQPETDSPVGMMTHTPQPSLNTQQMQTPQGFMQLQTVVGLRRAQSYLPGQISRATPGEGGGESGVDSIDRGLQFAINGLHNMLIQIDARDIPVVLNTVPDHYQEGLASLMWAARYRYGNGLSPIEDDINERYAPLGLQGFLHVLLYGKELKAHEEVQRQQLAIQHWQTAYPKILSLVDSYIAQGGGAYGMSLKERIQRLHGQMISELPKLMVNLEPLPPAAEALELFIQAKKTAENLDGFWMNLSKFSSGLAGQIGTGVGQVKSFNVASDKLTESEIKDIAAFENPDTPGPAAPNSYRTEPGGDPSANEKARQAALEEKRSARATELAEMQENPLEANALSALSWLKAATAQPQAWADALEAYKKGKFTGSVSMGLVAKDALADVAIPVAKAGIWTIELWEAKITKTIKDPDIIATVYPIFARAKSFKAGLEVLEKGLGSVTTLVDWVSSAYEFSNGLATGDFVAIASSVLSISQSAITSIVGTSAALPLTPFFILAKMYVQILAEVTKMYGAFHVADMKSATNTLISRVQYASDKINEFVVAAQQRAQLDQAAQVDEVIASLRREYEKMAVTIATHLPTSMAEIVKVFVDGELSEYPVIVQAFEQGLGGAGTSIPLLGKLQEMAGQVSALQGEGTGWDIEKLLELGHGLSVQGLPIAEGVKFAAQTVQGIAADVAGPVRFWGSGQEQDSLHLWLQVLPTSSGWLDLRWYDAELLSPIHDKKYRAAVQSRVADKLLTQLPDLPLEIGLHVGNGKFKMKIFEGELQSYEVDDFTQHEILNFQYNRGVKDPTVDGSVQEFWNRIKLAKFPASQHIR
jgi:hypothetical protein